MSPRYADVVLPLPLATSYTYRIPDGLAARVQPGARVVVPVRRRSLTGVVTAVDVPAPAVAARDLEAALDAEPSVPVPLLDLARWISGYYGAPLGLAVKLLLPTALWGTGSGAGERTERVLSLAPERLTLMERDERFRRRPKQRALYETLEALGGSAPVRHLMEQLGFGDGVIRSLARSGAAVIEQSERLRDPFAGVAGTPPPARLTAAQERALDGVSALGAGEGALLLGVTGSGKTLVYLEAVRRELAAGRGAIVLVPEIGLTPQTVSRFRGAFGDQVAVLHSALSDGERADAWRTLRRGERRVAVGARSAVLAPVTNLGLIVIDEEHEATYKNGEAPRYHARDVAGVRARLEGARLLLGSATPSLETIARTVRPEDDPAALIRLDLPDRIESRPLPPVELVDLRKAPLVPGTGSVSWSIVLDDAIGSALGRGEQVILLLNRRGFAAYLQCPDCGSVRHCPDCAISLTVHQTPAALRCHYCGHEESVPTACPECGGAVQRMRGVGTQQLERLVAERFPEARIGRMDLDTTSTKWSHQRILEAVERREIDILIGTQMIAKGLDFPNVTLVGVVDADTGLNLPDFRAAERSFQLLAQVGGRAGRGPRGGKVLVQTRCPDHHALVHAARHDTEGFLAAELALRESPPAPPVLALVNLVVSGLNEIEVGATAARVADWCQRLIDRHALPVTVLGPAPCPVARIKERWRWHAVLRGPSRELGRIVRTAARSLARGRREPAIVIDRDPVAML
ncbi:MAG: primosomal protein N' [Gemmatimonadota bacterium]